MRKNIIIIFSIILSIGFSQKSIVQQFSKTFADVAEKVNPAVVTINENTLHETLNAIYPFIDDHLAIKDISKFEDYRRNYPDRFEWKHFNTQFNIPQAKK